MQVDVARIGGITPWIKVAHMAEAYNVSVCPHFLMELHVSLVCAVNNTPWLEYIPQPGVDGAEIIIAPNSVTLPDGSDEGLIRFSRKRFWGFGFGSGNFD